MKITKAEREAVRAKFDGLCAYCGCALAKSWHVDHLEPVMRESTFVQGVLRATGKVDHPGRHCMENWMPACARCNISKSTLTLDQWRAWLTGHVCSLSLYNTPYKLAVAYGLIVETGAPIVFHFEKQP